MPGFHGLEVTNVLFFTWFTGPASELLASVATTRIGQAPRHLTGKLFVRHLVFAIAVSCTPASALQARAQVTTPVTADYPLTASIYSKTNENVDSGKVQISQYNLYVSDMVWWGLACGATYNCNTANPAATTVGQYLKQLNPNQTDLMYQHSIFMEKGGWSAAGDGRGYIINGTPYYIDLRWFLTYAGSALTSNISATGTFIPVSDVTKFAVGDNIILGGPGGQSTPEMMTVDAISATSGSGTLTVTRAQFNQNGKFPAVSHNVNDYVRSVVHAFGVQDFMAMNMSSNAPTSNINSAFGYESWNKFLASFWQSKMANDPSYSNLDGLYLDNFVSYQTQLLDNYSQIDYTNTNVATPVSTGGNNFTAGMTDLTKQLRNKLGAGKLLIGNTGGSASTNGAQLNAGMIEGTDQSWTNCMIGGDVTSTYSGWMSSGLSPQTFINNGSATVANPEFDYQAVRFELAMTLANNGYFDFDEFLAGGSSCGLNSGNHQSAWWYDEFDNGGKKKGYLGQPLGAASQPVAGVYRRNFQYGIALANNTSSTQTVALGGTYAKISASGRCPGWETSCTTPQTSPTTGNDGSTVTSITLQPHDGIILLGVPNKIGFTALVYGFEDGGLSGWAAGGVPGVSSVSNSTALAYRSTHSLAAGLANVSQTNWGSAHVTNPIWLAAGQTLTAEVQVPSSASSGLAASIFVQVGGTTASWNEGTPLALKPGTWTSISYTLPRGVALTQPVYLGVRFYPVSGTTTWSGTAYLDQVTHN